MTNGRTLIFVPTYNERDNVELLFSQIKALGLDVDYLFLDDNSPDGTGEVLDRLARENRGFHVLHRPGKSGIGSAHQAGIEWAYDQGYRTLLTMDADLTHSPSNIPAFLALAEECDIVVGSRYLTQGSLKGWNIVRKSLTLTAHVLTTLLLGMKYDATGAFRLYRLDRIPRQVFKLVASRGYSFFFESLYILHLNKLKIVEIPITLPPRTYGSSKMSYWEAFRSVKLLFKIYGKTVFRKKHFIYARSAASGQGG